MRLRVVLELVITAAVGVGLGASTSRAASLIVVDGILYGATNVGVGGSLYNVLFQTDTCQHLFPPCISASNFQFRTQASAATAAQALLSQVFIDGPLGAFDSDPSKTIGFSGLTGNQYAAIATPFSINFPIDFVVHTAMAVNCPAGSCSFRGGVDTVDTTFGFDSGGAPAHYAVWSPVPEPSTAMLLATGILALAAGRRRSLRLGAQAGAKPARALLRS